MSTMKARPKYETPTVVTYSDSDLRKQMGYLRGTTIIPPPAPQRPDSMNSLFYPESEDPDKSSKKYRSAFPSHLY
jgi:hypothetical protein